MSKFIDVENLAAMSHERNLINVQHIIRIERLEPGNENSPVNIHLIDGTIIFSNKPYSTYIKVLD